MAISFLRHISLRHTVKVFFWFFWGVILGFFFFTSFLFIFHQKKYANKVYTGVYVNGIDFGGKTLEEVRNHFSLKNERIAETQFLFSADDVTATVSAKQIEFGYDADLMAHQAYSVGRSSTTIANVSLMLQAYLNGIKFSPIYNYSEEKLANLLAPLRSQVEVKPVDGLFTFESDRVTAFKQSSDGQAVDIKALNERVSSSFLTVLSSPAPKIIAIEVPLAVIKPKANTDNADKLGIKEFVGEGSSLFSHSIENRVYNIGLASSRLHGVLIKPGEVFSFAKAAGDVSSLTGYKQAYIIANGKTILGDGGGVCQVSTTLFRAALNSGLPIIERNPHAYRVEYYEQDTGVPGIDAAVYVPSVDLKFKNDTDHHLLIQTSFDPDNYSLKFSLYGTKDNRQVEISKPIITSQTPAPEPLYQDDPNLPKGVVKQIDFAAAGAKAFFTRTVKRDGKVVISDKFTSNYRPWQAIYLRGTRE